ncbi:MAG: phospholipase D-like domain-containing protein [Anaerolineales bacterium]|nr:MAG: phospholipase D-like domain-containing protein [Anaerolineales bacterium]
MKKTPAFFLLLSMFLASCEPLDDPQVYVPVTPLPFYASDTPEPFIIPVTDTPAFIEPTTAIETPVLMPVDTWWEVHFTDPLTTNDSAIVVDSVQGRLIEFINDAQTSIHIASFEFNLTPVAEALIAAKNRGVEVKWMTDDKNGLNYDTQPGRGQFSLLIGAGIEVRDDARSALMHNKFWIFDQQIVWTGSTNITVNGVYKQNNNVLVIRSPQVASIYEREFQEMWSGQFGPRAPSMVNTQWTILDGTPVQVLFSPEDNVMRNLIALVKDARTSIRFLAFSFTDFPLAQVMIERANAGVDVKGVFETFGSNSPNSELRTFWCAGLPVRQDGNASFLHHKVIVVDNSIVVTGSLNFSANADEVNEENVLIVDNAGIAALYLQEFEKIWSRAQNVGAGVFTCP